MAKKKQEPKKTNHKTKQNKQEPNQRKNKTNKTKQKKQKKKSDIRGQGNFC